MKQKRITASDIDNIITESFLYKRFRLLATNMFKYGGLDDLTIEERHIENYMFDDGKAIFFNDKTLGLMCLPCQGIGVNVYGDPTKWRAIGFGYSKVYDVDDCVLIENNKLRMPTDEVVKYFVRQLYEIVRTRDINIKTLKLPLVLATDDKNVLSVKKVLDEIDNNVYALVTNKNVINLEEIIKVLPTGVKPYTQELTDQYHDILNECLTYLGINNANTDKRERLITDEANANNQFIESCANLFLESRQRAIDEVNKKFGTHITVELRNTDTDEGGKYAPKPIQEPTT